MKSKNYLIAILFFLQILSAQDSLSNRFGIFFEYPGYYLDRLGLKYCISNNDIVMTQFSIRTSLFNNENTNSSYHPEESFGYSFLLGYKKNIYTYKKLNLSVYGAVERSWQRSTQKEAIYEYDQFTQKSNLVRFVGTEDKYRTLELKLGIGSEYFIDDQFSLEILDRIHYVYSNTYRTTREWTSYTETSNSFSIDELILVVTYYF